MGVYATYVAGQDRPRSITSCPALMVAPMTWTTCDQLTSPATHHAARWSSPSGAPVIHCQIARHHHARGCPRDECNQRWATLWPAWIQTH